MDEFDVYMDAVNRRVAMENLFTFAAENDPLQFVFLTPQARRRRRRRRCLPPPADAPGREPTC